MCEILVEPELEGTYRKWNNNRGDVLHHNVAAAAASATSQRVTPYGMQGIAEDEDDDDDYATGSTSRNKGASDVDEAMQAFSHFSHSVTHGKKLVCDLQGVWNPTDGFTLTDPAIHYSSVSNSKRYGRTDKGQEGIDAFFATHRCNAWCRRLGINL